MLLLEGGRAMRIIAGEARGTALKTLPGTDVTRPTVARVKEGMFSAVQFLLPGARVLVNDLKAAGIGVWGLSNWESSLFHVAEEQCDILQQLDGKLVSGFVKLRKPHKEIYEAALNQFGIKADGALFIDDKAMNIVGSNAAGIRGVRFQDPVKLRELLIANGVNIPAVQ